MAVSDLSDSTCDLRCDAYAGFYGDEQTLTCGLDARLTGTPTCTACVAQVGCATSKTKCAASVAGGTKLECKTTKPGFYIENELVRNKACATDEYVDDSSTCQPCPVETPYNLAGDDATGPATSCDGYDLCPVNQCVVGHVLHQAIAMPAPRRHHARELALTPLSPCPLPSSPLPPYSGTSREALASRARRAILTRRGTT